MSPSSPPEGTFPRRRAADKASAPVYILAPTREEGRAIFADPRRRRLYYRCLYTGTKETDILLGQFARAHLADLPEAELTMLERLIDNGDPDLYDWISGRAPVPPAWDGPLMARLRAFRVELPSPC